ncbi:hypothetical protein V6582_12080 [Agrobacterium vitis]|uniref:hypothetical protein n=1 Tax=Agrobacterium vitis TaxID=373 RepID=UPI0012E6F744|nr:hypothetical protein [Agrobacterium vitis]
MHGLLEIFAKGRRRTVFNVASFTWRGRAAVAVATGSGSTVGCISRGFVTKISIFWTQTRYLLAVEEASALISNQLWR